VPEVLDTVDDTIKKEAPLLGFDSCIKLPIITYDPAGHCLAKEEAIYFKMPVDPTGEIRKEVNEFKDVFEKGMSDMTDYVDKEVAGVVKIEQDLRKDLVNLKKAIDDSDLALRTANSANTLSGEAKQKADDAFRVADEAKDLAQEINTQLTYIRGRLDSLENKA
jgi:HAMP domain-containing protein